MATQDCNALAPARVHTSAGCVPRLLIYLAAAKRYPGEFFSISDSDLLAHGPDRAAVEIQARATNREYVIGWWTAP
jgi:hypothetical protein